MARAKHNYNLKRKRAKSQANNTSSQPKKQSAHRINYAEYYRRLKTVHDFSFKLPRATPTKAELQKARASLETKYKQKFLDSEKGKKRIKEIANDLSRIRKMKPQQKSAITKLWYGPKANEKHPHDLEYRSGGLKNAVKQIEKGEAQFIKVKGAKNKKQLARMKKTNKGVVLYEANVKAKLKGKGKDLRIELERVGKLPPGWIRPRKTYFTRREIFFPFPPGVIIPDYIKMLEEKYKPNSISIGVMSARGSARYNNSKGLNYLEEVIADYKKRGVKHPFSGVYFFWY
jgi:hypothetical protein